MEYMLINVMGEQKGVQVAVGWHTVAKLRRKLQVAPQTRAYVRRDNKFEFIDESTMIDSSMSLYYTTPALIEQIKQNIEELEGDSPARKKRNRKKKAKASSKTHTKTPQEVPTQIHTSKDSALNDESTIADMNCLADDEPAESILETPSTPSASDEPSPSTSSPPAEMSSISILKTLCDKVEAIGNTVDEMKNNMDSMKKDVDSMKKDMDSMKKNMGTMKKNMDTMKLNIDELKQDSEYTKGFLYECMLEDHVKRALSYMIPIDINHRYHSVIFSKKKYPTAFEQLKGWGATCEGKDYLGWLQLLPEVHRRELTLDTEGVEINFCLNPDLLSKATSISFAEASTAKFYPLSKEGDFEMNSDDTIKSGWIWVKKLLQVRRQLQLLKYIYPECNEFNIVLISPSFTARVCNKVLSCILNKLDKLSTSKMGTRNTVFDIFEEYRKTNHFLLYGVGHYPQRVY